MSLTLRKTWSKKIREVCYLGRDALVSNTGKSLILERNSSISAFDTSLGTRVGWRSLSLLSASPLRDTFEMASVTTGLCVKSSWISATDFGNAKTAIGATSLSGVSFSSTIFVTSGKASCWMLWTSWFTISTTFQIE